MKLNGVYMAAAAAMALAAVAVALSPGLLLALADRASAEHNAAHIRLSFFIFAMWLVPVLSILARTRPTTADWPVPREIWLYVLWLVLCAAYTAFEHGWVDIPAYVYEEDGPLETATAVLLLVACIGFADASLRAGRTGLTASAACLAAAALVCFLFMMEEISWGQRIFGWETPENLERINVQNETNLHNVFQGANQMIRLFVVLIGSTCLVFPEAWRARLSRWSLGILVPGAHHVWFVPILIYSHVYDELFEEVMGVFLIVYMLELRRALRERTAQRARVSS